MSIYVEILIRAPMEALWDHTQTPTLHERWDLRFSRIEYLPRGSETEPQRFLYATRIGFGLQVAGEGESVGERGLADGSRSSALKFSSADARSIIREGSGYWKYIPTHDGIRFLTWYDYRTRFGNVGALFDRFAFRPVIGWATAWSFDRLRLWLEEGIDPALVMRQTLVHFVARAALALVFAYQGLAPKLFAAHRDEVAMLLDSGVAADNIDVVLTMLGLAEVGFALFLLVFWRRRWPSWLCLGLMFLAVVVVAVNSPRFLNAAFNPVSLNLAVASLAAVDLLVLDRLPSASRCRRQPSVETT
jgi:DoxX-like family